MAKTITKYSIFLASPSDVEYERNEIDKFIKEINLSFGNSNDIHLELKKWETHSAPGITNEYTQDIINNDIGDDYDIFVGLLWKKFGTPTPVAMSGTEEEFNRAVERFKNGENVQILVYFKNEGVQNISDIDPVQLIKVNDFKKSLSEAGVFYSTFSSIEELGNQLRLHIPKRIAGLGKIKTNEINHSNSSLQITNTESKDKVIIDEDEVIIDEDDFGFFDYMFDFQALMWSSNTALTSIELSTKDVATQLDERTVEITFLNQSGNANPHQYLSQFKMVSKILLDYVKKLKLDTDSFYENFESAIKTGLKFINTYTIFDDEEYSKNLLEIYESSIILKENIPKGIEGMKGFRDTIRSLPKIQSNINHASKVLEKQLDDLVLKLSSSYKLTIEFMSEIELKLNIK
ncbi:MULTISPECIES: DUF4062 domain-containing protein [Sphingobacterium]|uniref:DUF4062 domain-containing protein n=1 Tax=Sphingobacterium TaxID=28453 RepID=UPI00257A2997|nr:MULTISPECIES: DUF4062 domain-containing protein [Sphingobacterium]